MDEGVLIIGSSSETHNLRAIGPRNSPPAPWALENLILGMARRRPDQGARVPVYSVGGVQ
ncbi:hypothetical protein HN51_055312 [Arachis hypogaea]